MKHQLVTCQGLNRERGEMRANLGPGEIKLETLLSEGGDLGIVMRFLEELAHTEHL